MYILENPQNIEVIKILTKFNLWEHEQKSRFLIKGTEKYYKIGDVTKLYFSCPYKNLYNKNAIEKSPKVKEYIFYRNILKKYMRYFWN